MCVCVCVCMCVCVCVSVCARREATQYREQLFVVKPTMTTFLFLEELCGHWKHSESQPVLF